MRHRRRATFTPGRPTSDRDCRRGQIAQPNARIRASKIRPRRLRDIASTRHSRPPCNKLPVSAASIWPVWLQSSSIAGLPMITRPGSSSATTPLRILATASGSTIPSVLTSMPRSVVASACAASRSLAPARSTRLRLPSPCLPAKRFLDGDLVEWVHRHLDVGELHARTVRLDADLDVVIHHARCRRSLQASPAT